MVLEVKTMGTKGLRYRSWLPNAQTNGWEDVPSVKAPTVADTCGAGDWCTAGILATLARQGQAGLATVTASELKEAVHYGQVLAAWNVGFEGARGGMYEVDKATFTAQIRRIAKGAAPSIERVEIGDDSIARVPCPACPPVS
jgi:fructokinase